MLPPHRAHSKSAKCHHAGNYLRRKMRRSTQFQMDEIKSELSMMWTTSCCQFRHARMEEAVFGSCTKSDETSCHNVARWSSYWPIYIDTATRIHSGIIIRSNSVVRYPITRPSDFIPFQSCASKGQRLRTRLIQSRLSFSYLPPWASRTLLMRI